MATIAILGPGDLGTRLATVLTTAGHSVVTTLEGRGPRTRALCRERGLAAVATLEEAVSAAGIVICTVPPDAALDAARAFAAVTRGSAPPVYADANSIAPERAREIADLVEAAGAPFVSAAVHGSGTAFAETGQLFLSGRDVAPVAGVAEEALRVVRLGADPGSAKELKLLVAAMSKGLCALYMEAGRAAARAGLLDDTDAALRHAYPAMMDDLERMIPSYARHSGRRASELVALADLETRLGVTPEMATATLASVRRIPDDLGASAGATGPEERRWTARSMIAALAGA